MAKINGSGVQLRWETIIMTIGLVLVMVGGFWTLAYIPIDNNQKRLEQQIKDLQYTFSQHLSFDDAKYLTQKEHNEFKVNVRDADDRHSRDITELRRQIDTIRAEAISRADFQQVLNTTRVEFLAEIKRLDQGAVGNMKRMEFDIWQTERNKTIGSIQDRQNRFSEALDAMYSRLMLQMPSYAKPQ